jgi:Transcriptional regulator containing GAF, AAA-type ATPase, and DNA binding domains
VRDETSELRLLFEVSQALEASSELTDQLDAALGLMARYTGMMRGTLALLTPDGREIEVEASFGLKPHQLERARYKLGEGVTGRVIETGTPVVVPNVSKEPLFLNKTGARDLAKEDISFICVPIKIGGETLARFPPTACLTTPCALKRMPGCFRCWLH